MRGLLQLFCIVSSFPAVYASTLQELCLLPALHRVLLENSTPQQLQEVTRFGSFSESVKSFFSDSHEFQDFLDTWKTRSVNLPMDVICSFGLRGLDAADSQDSAAFLVSGLTAAFRSFLDAPCLYQRLPESLKHRYSEFFGESEFFSVDRHPDIPSQGSVLWGFRDPLHNSANELNILDERNGRYLRSDRWYYDLSRRCLVREKLSAYPLRFEFFPATQTALLALRGGVVEIHDRKFPVVTVTGHNMKLHILRTSALFSAALLYASAIPNKSEISPDSEILDLTDNPEIANLIMGPEDVDFVLNFQTREIFVPRRSSDSEAMWRQFVRSRPDTKSSLEVLRNRGSTVILRKSLFSF